MSFPFKNREPLRRPTVTAEEAETFEKVSAVLRDGGVFLGNFWTQGGYFEIRVEHGGHVIVFTSPRCFPGSFDPKGRVLR